MIEQPKHTNAISSDRGAPREERSEWERPQIHKLDMSDAETNTATNFDGTVGFS